jgi:hypothetical protein
VVVVLKILKLKKVPNIKSVVKIVKVGIIIRQKKEKGKIKITTKEKFMISMLN